MARRIVLDFFSDLSGLMSGVLKRLLSLQLDAKISVNFQVLTEPILFSLIMEVIKSLDKLRQPKSMYQKRTPLICHHDRGLLPYP